MKNRVIPGDGASLSDQPAARYSGRRTESGTEVLRHAEEAKVLDGIRRGLEDVKAGRTQPLATAFADLHPDLD